jgi:hypothetical protein
MIIKIFLVDMTSFVKLLDRGKNKMNLKIISLFKLECLGYINLNKIKINKLIAPIFINKCIFKEGTLQKIKLIIKILSEIIIPRK